MTAELDARVTRHVELGLDLEHEIAVGLFGAKEGVGAFADFPHDAAVFHPVAGFTAGFAPPGQRLAVEEPSASGSAAVLGSGPMTAAIDGSKAAAQIA